MATLTFDIVSCFGHLCSGNNLISSFFVVSPIINIECFWENILQFSTNFDNTDINCAVGASIDGISPIHSFANVFKSIVPFVYFGNSQSFFPWSIELFSFVSWTWFICNPNSICSCYLTIKSFFNIINILNLFEIIIYFYIWNCIFIYYI